MMLLTTAFSILLVACGQIGDADPGSLTWISVAIGYDEVSTPAVETTASSMIELTGAGKDIWGTGDEFRFMYTTLRGNGSLTVRLDDLSAEDGWSKAGVMIRDGLAPDAVNALIHVSRDNGAVFQARLAAGQNTVNSAGTEPNARAPMWIRLTRLGSEVRGELSGDGRSWSEVGRYEIDLASQLQIGMAVTAHSTYGMARASFSNVSLIEGPVPNLPSTPAPDPYEPVAPPKTFELPPATMYVATNGNDGNSGRSESAPLRTLARAASLVRPGDVVYLRGGVYPIQVRFIASGTVESPIVWASYPGEWAILDGSSQTRAQDSDRVTLAGASFNVIANLEVRHGPQVGIHVSGGHDNLFTGLLVHGHHGSGIMVHNGNRNRFEHLAVYDNFDELNTRGEPGQDADGISVSSGDGNVISYVLSFRNSDDGIDAWKSTNTLIEYSVSHNNGAGSHGNGNGFKAGGGIDNHTTVRNSIAYGNRSAGFTNNGGINVMFVNNTAIYNLGPDFEGHEGVTFTNNLSVNGLLAVGGSVQKHNNWNIGISDPRLVSAAPGDPGFLSLRSDSPAIDAGVDAGYPFQGGSPDLGALEYGSVIADLTQRSAVTHLIPGLGSSERDP
ncbi:MAG: right-handed parallel beta-helix repeat-containing protein [Trueperaceae bacterium]